MGLAESQYVPLLAYIVKARANAKAYGMPGLHYNPHAAPWGFVSTLGASPGGDMSLHWSGVLSALNLISHWEYTADEIFLRGIAFPFCRDTLKLYQSWMTRSTGGSDIIWRNDRDSDECDNTNQTTCYLPNMLYPNGFIRRVAQALPDMAAALGEPIDPQWAEIATKLVALSSGPSAPGAPGPTHSVWLSSDDASPTTGFKHPPGDGDMAALLWPVFPGEVVGRNSSQELLDIGRGTLLDLNGWLQGNSFCMIFTAATRLRVPLEQWWPAWQLR